MVQIFNVKSDRIEAGFTNIYCGRLSSFNYAKSRIPSLYECSSLGNQHWVSNESQRDWSCNKFRDETFPVLLRTEKTLALLNRIKRIHLVGGKVGLWCWCAPLRCHTETIKAWLELPPSQRTQ